MRVCIFGAGAIGGYIAARLAMAGRTRPVLIARGAHLDALRGNGLTLAEGGNETTVPVEAGASGADFGEQDYVLLALKAHSVAPALDALAPLLGPETAVVTLQNGLPWWYFYRHGGALEGTRLSAVDPDGAIWERIGPERAIGGVVYAATEVVAPGVIRHVSHSRLSLGEPSGEKSDRVRALATELVAAGLQAPVRPDIRTEIWVKLWGNLSFNPVSALTGGTLEAIVADPESRSVVRAMMIEAQTIAERLGVHFPIDVDKRIEGARQVGAHKTSMLQDLERGRALEIDPLVTAVQEAGRLAGVATPTVDIVLALTRSLATARGCYAAAG